MIILEYPKEYLLKFPIKDNIVLRFIKETHTPFLGLCWISYYYSIVDYEKNEIVKEFNEDINLSQLICLAYNYSTFKEYSEFFKLLYNSLPYFIIRGKEHYIEITISDGKRHGSPPFLFGSFKNSWQNFIKTSSLFDNYIEHLSPLNIRDKDILIKPAIKTDLNTNSFQAENLTFNITENNTGGFGGFTIGSQAMIDVTPLVNMSNITIDDPNDTDDPDFIDEEN